MPSRVKRPLGATQEPSESKCAVSVKRQVCPKVSRGKCAINPTQPNPTQEPSESFNKDNKVILKVESKISDKNKSYTVTVFTTIQNVTRRPSL